MKYYIFITRLVWGVFFFVFLQACGDKEESEPPVSVFTVDPEFVTLSVGESCQLVARLNGVALNGDEVRWEANTNLVSVDNTGKVTAVAYNEFISGIKVSAYTHNGLYAASNIVINQNYSYIFRLVLKDKGTTGFSLSRPEEFLSVSAVEKRRKRNIPIAGSDLPLSEEYLAQIEKVGGKIVSRSKWLQTVCVQSDDPNIADEYMKLPFVEDVVMVWRGNKEPAESESLSERYFSRNAARFSAGDYGKALVNISIHNGQVLHDLGYTGEGIDIAVIDAGFIGLPDNPALNDIHIKGARSFIYGKSDPYADDNHGVWVTSCMATNRPGYFIGTAPGASYWLLRSEDMTGDCPVEEDYWAAAVEYADSVGADIVNTSLYYITYDPPFTSHKYEEMDGKTALATRAANMAASKGMLIVCCTGNDGSWVGTPADSPDVLTVGSVDKNGEIGSFTAYGITVDGRMKPDIVSLGQSAYTIGPDGTVGPRSGTSYASPILCGLAACLWQAYPRLTNRQLSDILKRSADRYGSPQLPYGYGIPDIRKAIELIREISPDDNLQSLK
ncbi:S8 family serine peptidase [Coprobacter tertius]|uniref:S8 family serine peptidase n=1 Tax=Coprobacter tertius TaxID=2944915 RepID=A0ABT1MGC5_9BACT|nr:S8 family serine peptidase [Coprobacter tertius]MCP9611682.1 S8 family serine peptidase [Coprobacter tertius]